MMDSDFLDSRSIGLFSLQADSMLDLMISSIGQTVTQQRSTLVLRAQHLGHFSSYSHPNEITKLWFAAYQRLASWNLVRFDSCLKQRLNIYGFYGIFGYVL